MKNSRESAAVNPSATGSKIFLHKLWAELKAVGLVTMLFAGYFLLMMFLKRLVLEQYEIQFRGVSRALVGALIVAKVVILLEHVSLGGWLRRRAVIVEVVLRTIFYAVGVALVLLLEKAFESRHEAGGFGAAVTSILAHRDIYHVWATAIGVSLALLVFNAAAKIQGALGKGGLPRFFFKTTLEEIEAPPSSKPAVSKRAEAESDTE